MNRPRISILEQFDPLLSEEKEPATSATLESDYEEDSEKENAAPEPGDMTMTTFFSRVSKPSYPTPKKLTKRLIDVGDVTLSEISLDIPEEEEEDGEGNDSLCLPATPKPHVGVVKCSDSTLRTPLADITSHHDDFVLPLSRKKTFPHSPKLKKRLDTSPAPASSLSFAINSVNTAGISFGRSRSGSATKDSPTLKVPQDDVDDDHAVLHARSRTPEIQIHISETEDLGRSEIQLNKVSAPFMMSVNEADTSATSLLTPPVPRPNAVNLSTNRHSLDLQASFQLHLQSPESSFDLLNDKISFFDGHSKEMGSFTLDEEEAEGQNILIEKEEGDEDENSPSATPTNSLTPEKPAPLADTNGTTPESPTVESTDTPSGDVPGPESSPVSSRPLTLLAAERAGVLSTPGYKNHVAYIPPVPALRIVKRTKRYETSKAGSSAPVTVSSQESAEASRKIPSPPNAITRPGSSASTRSASSTSSNEARPKSAAAPVRPPPTRAAQPPPRPANPRAPMPMRVPVADSSSIAISAPKQNPLIRRPPLPKLSGTGPSSAAAQVVPRRVLVAESSLTGSASKGDAAKQTLNQGQSATRGLTAVRPLASTGAVKPSTGISIARLASTRSASGVSRK
uniref:Uncharacterized protein n=1 Tax=Moniliophthora roreri TaxID=221103 RepID=A0A0W0FGC1_MONRR